MEKKMTMSYPAYQQLKGDLKKLRFLADKYPNITAIANKITELRRGG
jgi:hypothetical protein